MTKSLTTQLTGITLAIHHFHRANQQTIKGLALTQRIPDSSSEIQKRWS